MNRKWLVALVLVFAVVAAACGSRDDDGETGANTTPSAPSDDGGSDGDTDGDGDGDGDADADAGADDATTTTAGGSEVDCSQPLEATEIGVTADTISLVVMADSDSPLAPGLFQGAADGAIAWVEAANDRGGLACRQLEIEFWDSKLNPTETTNGFLRACETALAMIGTNVLFGSDASDLGSCPDMAGNPTGVPEMAYITTEPPHQCNPTSFALSRPASSCPYSGGEREHVASVGAHRWLADQNGGPFTGAFLVPNDLPSTLSSSIPQINGHEAAGAAEYPLRFGVSGRATQSEFAQYMQPVRDGGIDFVYNGSNDQTMIKFRSEAAAQGLPVDDITWMCSLACYTPAFLDAGDTVEGTYVWLSYIPFEEADTNDELANFMDNIGKEFPEAWAAGAWGSGVLFEQAVTAIVERDGPNGLTRQALIDELSGVSGFDVNGWWGEVDFADTLTISPCFVMLQVQGGEFVRVFPEEPGTMNCDESNTVEITANPDTFQTTN